MNTSTSITIALYGDAAMTHALLKDRRRERLLCKASNNLYRKGDTYRGREADRRLDTVRRDLYGEC